ncbi:MAG: YraN family protein [Pseudomonadota bacterium]
MARPTQQARQKAERKGHRAERLAAWALRLKGYRIVGQRFKTPVGEIDLIARKGNTIAFVEVKARADAQVALDSVTFKSQRRISKAGLWWIGRQKDHAKLSWRFDVVAVVPRRWPIHTQRVWD